MKIFATTSLLTLVSSVQVRAQDLPVVTSSDSSIWSALGHCALFGALGILLVIAGFKIFDLIITKIDIEQEIAKGNIAAALLSAAAILGISIIVAFAIN